MNMRGLRVIRHPKLIALVCTIVVGIWAVWTTSLTIAQISTSQSRLQMEQDVHHVQESHNNNVQSHSQDERVDPTASFRRKKSVMSSSLSSSSSSSSSSISNFPKWLLAYAEFHQRHIMTDPWSGQRVVKPGTRTLLWVCPTTGEKCHGLGDRIKGIAQALYMAICLDRVLLIEWERMERLNYTHPAPQLNDFLQPNLIEWDATIVPSSFSYSDTTTTPSKNSSRNEERRAVVIRTMDNQDYPILQEPSLLRAWDDHLRIELFNNQWTNDRDHLGIQKTQCMQDYFQRFHIDGYNTNHNNTSTYHDQKDGTTPFSETTTTTTTTSNDSSMYWWDNEMFRLAFDFLFQWNPRVRTVARQIKKQAQVAHRGTTYIGVHIRVGGPAVTWDDPQRHHDPQEWLTFYQCGQRFQHALAMKCSRQKGRQENRGNNKIRWKNNSSSSDATMGGSSSSIQYTASSIRGHFDMYVASDSVKAKKYLLEEDWIQQNNNSLTTSVRTVLDLNIAHIQLSEGIDRDAYYIVWAEFLILIEATCLVHSRSGFSEIAAQLMKSTTSSVIPNGGRVQQSVQTQRNVDGQRCAVRFDQCQENNVRDAIRDIQCPSTSLWSTLSLDW